jgi:hypothetical protein
MLRLGFDGLHDLGDGTQRSIGISFATSAPT